MDITERLRHPDLHDRPYPLCAEAAGEIHRLRAELSANAEILNKFVDDNDPATLREERDRLRAELAAMTKRAETAEDTVGCQTDLEQDFAAARAELATLRLYADELARDSNRDLAAKNARIAALKAQLRHMHTFDGQHRARIAELEEANSEIAVEALRDHRKLRARAERAEAEADSLRNTVDNMRAMNIKLTWEATGKTLAAEAERAAMREAVRKIRATDNITAVWHIADAALAPSTAGREG